MPDKFEDLSNAELRLALAEALYERPRTLRAIWIKRDRVSELTQELVRRGAY